MEVQDEYIPQDQFRTCLENMPQTCVEVVLETEDGVLLCERTRKPKELFWPGSRLYKGEQLEDAAHRVAREELGIEILLSEQLGVHGHFWSPEQTEVGVSRHTVNIVYLATPESSDFEIELDEQHSGYRFVTDTSPELHEYVQEYLTKYNLV